MSASERRRLRGSKLGLADNAASISIAVLAVSLSGGAIRAISERPEPGELPVVLFGLAAFAAFAASRVWRGKWVCAAIAVGTPIHLAVSLWLLVGMAVLGSGASLLGVLGGTVHAAGATALIWRGVVGRCSIDEPVEGQ